MYQPLLPSFLPSFLPPVHSLLSSVNLSLSRSGGAAGVVGTVQDYGDGGFTYDQSVGSTWSK
jgi:hypothetical protein